MEDLSLRGARFPNALDELGVAHVRALLRSLAALHARFWESPRFEADLSWVPTVSRGGMHEVFSSIGFGLIRDHVARNPFEQALIAPLGLSVEQLWEGTA